MPATGVIVSGQTASFSVAVSPPPGHRDVPGLRLSLLTPDKEMLGVDTGLISYANGEARAEIVLHQPGRWEYQWQDADRVYEHGRLFVRKTGFSA